MSEDTSSFVREAVERAIAEEIPTDGILHLKNLLCEGYRTEISDQILDRLETSRDYDVKSNALELLYFLHGVGTGIYFGSQSRNPRPEDGGGRELIEKRPLERLCRLAAQEPASNVWDSYAATLNCILAIVAPSEAALRDTNDFCRRVAATGTSFAKERCQMISDHLSCGGQ